MEALRVSEGTPQADTDPHLAYSIGSQRMSQRESLFFRRLQPLKKRADAIAVSPQLIEAARKPQPDVLATLNSSAQGLSSEEAERRLEEYGPNAVAQEKPETWFTRLFKTTINPLVILLAVLATVSFA